MATLDIEFSLHDHLPDQPSSPFVLVPLPNNSQWRFNITDGPTLRNHQDAVAVYFDKNPQRIAVEHHCGLEKWPARSTDRLLHLLAARLKRLHNTSNPTDTTQTPTDSSSHIAGVNQRTDRTAQLIMGLLIAALVVMFVFTDRSNNQPTDSLATDMPTDETNFNISAQENEGNHLLGLRDYQTAESKQKDMQTVAHDPKAIAGQGVQASATKRSHEPTQQTTRLQKHPTNTVQCANDNQVLQATLTWQQDTSFACHLNSAHSSPLWVTSSNTKATIQKHTE